VQGKLPALALTLLAIGCGSSEGQSSLPSREIPSQNGYDPREKQNRTPVQQKIDSQLLHAARLASGTLNSDQDLLQRDAQGRVAVDINGKVTDSLLETIRREGGEVVGSYPQFDSVRAYVLLKSLETIAASKQVRTIVPAALPVNRTELNPTGKPKLKPTTTNARLSQLLGNKRRKKVTRRTRQRKPKPRAATKR
jgi:hypothetical protein